MYNILPMMLTTILLSCITSFTIAEDITFIRDPGVYGPPLETVHAYYNQWPTGK